MGCFESRSVPAIPPERLPDTAATVHEHILDAIAQHVPTGLVASSTGTGGEIIWVNDHFAAMSGWTLEELRGRPRSVLVPERFRAAHEQRAQAARGADSLSRALCASGTTVLLLLRKDGSELPVDILDRQVTSASGASFLLSKVSDATELVCTAEKLRHIMEAVPCGIMLLQPDGTITVLNSIVVAMFGYSRQEMLGIPIESLVPATARAGHAALRNAFLAAPQDRTMGAGRTLYGVRKDGSQFPIEVTLKPFNDPANQQVMVAVVQEISARMAQQQRERDAEERLSTARSALLATLSHEVRTPLTAVIGSIELLQGLSNLPAEARDLVNTCQGGADSVLSVVNNVLDFAKLEAGGMIPACELFDPRRVFGDVSAIVSSKAHDKGLSLNVALDGSIPAVLEGDPSRLRQMLLHLANNAVKYTENGGVTICADCVPVATADGARDAASPTPARLHARVADSGIGISAEDQLHLFRPFLRIDNSSTRRSGGTGLGLVICRNIATMLGGSLRVSSELGKGSKYDLVIAVRVPRCPAASVPVVGDAAYTGADAPTARATRTQLDVDSSIPRPPLLDVDAHVLVAEDDSVCQRIICSFLGKLGCRHVTAVGNGREAVAAVASTQVRLVLMDCEMPVLDGFGAVSEIRRSGCDIPIVALTANTMVGDRERCLSKGMNDYLAKPVRLAELRACLAHWLPSPHVWISPNHTSAPTS